MEPTGQQKGGGREGEGKGSGAQEHSAQLAGGRQSRQLCGPLPAEERVWLRLAGAGHFLSSWGQFSLPREMERETRQACGGSQRTPSFPEPSTVCVLTGNLLYRLKRRESSRRAVHSHNPIPSEKHAFGVSCFLFLHDPYISGGCCHQTGMHQCCPPLGVA